jgi:hypothetical protein
MLHQIYLIYLIQYVVMCMGSVIPFLFARYVTCLGLNVMHPAVYRYQLNREVHHLHNYSQIQNKEDTTVSTFVFLFCLGFRDS